MLAYAQNPKCIACHRRAFDDRYALRLATPSQYGSRLLAARPSGVGPSEPRPPSRAHRPIYAAPSLIDQINYRARESAGEASNCHARLQLPSWSSFK